MAKRRELPYMPLYVSDFFGSPEVAALDWQSQGLYLVLLARAWQTNDGSLPDDESTLVRLLSASGAPAHWQRTRTATLRKRLRSVVNCFFERRDGRLYNKRLEVERESLLEARKAASEGGKKGAQKRWGTHKGGVIASIPSPSPSHPTHCGVSNDQTIEARWQRFLELASEQPGISSPVAYVDALRRQYADPDEAGVRWWDRPEEAKRAALIERIRKHAGKTTASGSLVTQEGLEGLHAVWPYADMSDDELEDFAMELEDK